MPLIRLIWLLTLFILGCGPESNPFGRSIPSPDLEAFDVQLSLGQAYLDTGDTQMAQFHAEKAISLNPGSEDAAVLLGYVYLNLLGLSAFDIASKFNKKNDKASGDEKTDPFAPMKSLLGITESDLLKIATLNTDFPKYPILEPKCALDARLAIEALKISERGVKAICPFVDPEVLITTDQRHQCESSSGRRKKSVQSHFLWLMLHLYEGSFFNSVINYKTISAEKTNLELRVNQVVSSKPTTVAQITRFLSEVDSVSLSVVSVFDLTGENCPTENPQTMLLALVNDLLTTSLALSRMPGIPENIKAKFQQMASFVSDVRDSKAADTLSQATTLRRSLAKDMAKTLADTINDIDVNTLSEKDKTDLCVSYNQIAGKTADLPSVCQ